MESPECRGLWDAVEDAERRAVADFLTPAGSLPGEGGTGRSALPGHRLDLPAGPVPGPARPAAEGEGQRAAPPVVIVAPEIAVRIVAAFTTGTSIAALANQQHLTPGEVIRLITGRPAASERPDVVPEMWADRALATALLRAVLR